jgi:hypothetical protein
LRIRENENDPGMVGMVEWGLRVREKENDPEE